MNNLDNIYLTKNTSDNADKWISFKKTYKFISTIISINNNGDVHIQGKLSEPLKSRLLTNQCQIYIQYWAPAPPDFRHSNSGSGLPFPNEDFAYSNTINTGRSILARDGTFVINIKYPNSFYKILGTILVKPNIKFLIVDENSNIYSEIYTIQLGNNIQNRSLHLSKQRNGPYFYDPRHDFIGTKSGIYKDSIYTMKEYINFRK